MCGIVGAIGLSTKPQLSFDLLTALLVKTEMRGDDATGFWASYKEEDKNQVFFSKEPEKSSLFVKNNWVWNAWKEKPIDLLIAHCRKRTMSNGSETNNINNHPFLSKNGDIALVHNGNVPEFDMLKSDYEVKSDCDSEVLLRVLESGAGYEPNYQRATLAPLNIAADKKVKDVPQEESLPFWCKRMMGLRDIFARVNHGALAVAVSEIWPDDTRALWLFRNKERPLHVVDLREQLGQIFFVSTPEIWRNAVDAVPAAKELTKQNVIEFPDMHVWLLSYDLKKFQNRKWKIVQKRKYDTSFDKERPVKPVPVAQLANQPLMVTNVDLTDFTVIKKPGNDTAVIKWEDNKDKEKSLIPFKVDDEIVLQCLVGKTYTEDEAKKSFLTGEEWLADGSRVTIHSIPATARVKLRYSNLKPPIELTVPKLSDNSDNLNSDSKKNFRPRHSHIHLNHSAHLSDFPIDGMDSQVYM